MHLEWWEGPVPRESPARLSDVGRGGARLAAEIPPRVHREVRLRFDRPAATEWLGAMVIRRRGPSEVGLAFRDLRPEDFLKLLAFGCRCVGCTRDRPGHAAG